MIKKLILLFILGLTASCASVASRYEYNVKVKSSPSEVNFKIIDKNGDEIYSGITPSAVSLNSGGGYFLKAKYSIEFEKEGYATKKYDLVPTLNEWYFINFPFLNILGLLIVDPFTGAMYKLSENVEVSLTKNLNNNP